MSLAGDHGPAAVDAARIGQIFREESGRCVATLTRIFRDLDLAEEAVQEAFAVALDVWPERGLPANPGGWITTTARNRAINHLNRDTRGQQLLREIAALNPDEPPTAPEVGAVSDDVLRLLFTCCHPALAAEAQLALTLRLLGGLTTEEVAQAFLVSGPTMAQRLVRAKRKIKAARIPYRLPEEHDLPDRLQSVLAVIYLIYNAGLSSPAGDELRAEAIRLARTLTQLMPDEPEVAGLLALLLLTDARAPARSDANGALVVLDSQDRTLWDRTKIEEGHAIVRRCLRGDQPGPYQLQPAINAVHTDARTAEQTDWKQIVELYDQLLALWPTPVVALNRAIAIGEVHGPHAALAIIDHLDLGGYAPYHATRADLLARLGRHDQARDQYHRAAELAPTLAERDFLSQGGRHGA